jgi:hypothetical protein
MTWVPASIPPEIHPNGGMFDSGPWSLLIVRFESQLSIQMRFV